MNGIRLYTGPLSMFGAKAEIALLEKGLDFEWQRVYGWAPEAHVRFEHAPHIRAKVECSTCHGDQAAQTVAERAVNMDMAFCVNCHKTRQASNDCLTCHF